MVAHTSKPDTVILNVSLPSDLVAAIDQVVGAAQRDAFVRAAIGDRIRRIAAFREGLARLQDTVIPEWETPESTAAWLREIRDWPDHWADDSRGGG